MFNLILFESSPFCFFSPVSWSKSLNLIFWSHFFTVSCRHWFTFIGFCIVSRELFPQCFSTTCVESCICPSVSTTRSYSDFSSSLILITWRFLFFNLTHPDFLSMKEVRLTAMFCNPVWFIISVTVSPFSPVSSITLSNCTAMMVLKESILPFFFYYMSFSMFHYWLPFRESRYFSSSLLLWDASPDPPLWERAKHSSAFTLSPCMKASTPALFQYAAVRFGTFSK